MGILAGYTRVRLGPQSGWDLLQRYPLQWAHALPFFTATDLELLLDQLSDSDFKNDLSELVYPVLSAMDRTFQTQLSGGYPLPRLGRFGLQPARLEASLSLPAQAKKGVLKFVCFLGPSIEVGSFVDDALTGGASFVVVRTDPQLWLAREATWHSRVVDATRIGSADDHRQSVADRTLAILRSEIAETAPNRQAPEGLIHNYAAEFPLRDSIVRQFYLVERQSVRRLLDTFSHGTGAHVWCSVRRSGKTTATVDLAGETDRSVVIFQTMDQQPNQPDLNLFYSRVLSALEKGSALPADFFEDAVRECSLASAPDKAHHARKVFIIDEYETLFGLLNAAARRDDWLQHAVAQPFLSQMVAFSTNNLLVFLGQRPDAHYILMTQNQLSPLVQQDSFPLFEHLEGSTATEFAHFLNKVLTPRLPFAPAFVDAIYQETSGHPYLTVNLMVDFCQWLIENQHQAEGSPLTAGDFNAFRKDRLSPAVLQRSSHYSTFQQMIADNLSEATRTREPWLYAVTTVLQRIGKQKYSKEFACSEPRFMELATDVARIANTSPGQLLQTAEMANFLTTYGGQVRPAIRLLARLAAVAIAEVN